MEVRGVMEVGVSSGCVIFVPSREDSSVKK